MEAGTRLRLGRVMDGATIAVPEMTRPAKKPAKKSEPFAWSASSGDI
jgi:hypothetical protein